MHSNTAPYIIGHGKHRPCKNRAETVQPWLTKQKSHEIFRSTASTVDIPNHWDPQAKQQPTGLIACGAVRRRLVRAPSIVQTKRKTSTQRVLVFLGAMEGTRTPGLLIRSQSLYPAELPTHTFRSEQDVFYHAGRGLSTVFCRFFDFIFVFYFFTQKSTSFRFFNIFRADLRLPLPGARRCGHRSALQQGRPGQSHADQGRADCPRGPWHR